MHTDGNTKISSAAIQSGAARDKEPLIQLVVTIDTECDKGPKWRVRHPLSFRNVVEGIPARLQPLFEAYGVKPTYLLSPEVLADDRCAELFRSLRGTADLGTHLHSEFIGPDAELQPSRTSAVQCDLSADVEFEKLANLTHLFQEKVGYRPIAFRAGRFGIGYHTLASLERLGYRVDSSVTPNRWWWIERGRGVNFLGAPVQPYHPSPDDFRRPGGMTILEVPVTVLHPIWDRLPRRLLLGLRPLSRYQSIILNLLNANDRKCRWLRPTFAASETMFEIARALRLRSGTAPVVLCMMFHSNEATAGTSPYHMTDAEVARFLESLSVFFEMLRKSYTIASIGLSDVPSNK